MNKFKMLISTNLLLKDNKILVSLKTNYNLAMKFFNSRYRIFKFLQN